MSDSEREPSGVKLAPKAVVARVSLYLRQLEAYQRQGFTTVSSIQLSAPLSVKNAQVRKDLAFFGQFGHPGVGYRIDELIETLRHILGIDHDWPLALVGLGNLGVRFCAIADSARAAFTSSLFSTTTLPRSVRRSMDCSLSRWRHPHGDRPAQDPAGSALRADRCGPACGRSAGLRRNSRHPQLRSFARYRARPRQPRARGSERATRKLGL